VSYEKRKIPGLGQTRAQSGKGVNWSFGDGLNFLAKQKQLIPQNFRNQTA
jgi:hypothetical protein